MVAMSISTGDVMGHSLVGVHLAPIGDVLFAPYGCLLYTSDAADE